MSARRSPRASETFKVFDGRDLGFAQALFRERRHVAQASFDSFFADPLSESFRLVESKDVVAGCVRLKAVGEAGFYTRTLIAERQRLDRSINKIRQAYAVFFGLALNVGKGLAFFLGFNDTERLGINKKKIVSLAKAGHGELAHGDATGKRQVELFTVLDFPASSFQKTIYSLARLIFRRYRHSGVLGMSFREIIPSIVKGMDRR